MDWAAVWDSFRDPGREPAKLLGEEFRDLKLGVAKHQEATSVETLATCCLWYRTSD